MRGFIFAPLVGTLLLLSALLLVTHFSRSDAAEVNRIVSDAYHNRLVSLLEATRSDTAAIFRMLVARTTQNYIVLTDYVNLKQSGDLDTLSGVVPFTSAPDERERMCIDFRNTIKDSMCVDSASGVYQGMPRWMQMLKQSVPFEGVQMGPDVGPCFDRLSDFDAFAEIASCKTYMRDLTFDCAAYKIGTLSCTDGAGCEDGTFYANVDVERLYKIMPRMCARDGAGNSIRSGALSDRDFRLHITSRTFRYVDLQARLTEMLAFGVTSTSYGIKGGMLTSKKGGFCIGSGCPHLTGYNYRKDGTGAAESTSPVAATYASEVFFDNVLKPACAKIESMEPKIKVEVDIGGAWKQCSSSSMKSQWAGGPPGKANSAMCPDSTKWCGHYDLLTLDMRFVDNEPRYWAEAGTSNKYEFHIKLTPDLT
jgi:hypothetical protein